MGETRMLKIVIVITTIIILATIIPATADSLWTPASTNMFTDLRARHVGDLLTVVISEGTASSLSASSGFDKNVEHSNTGGVGPFLKLLPEIGFNSGQKGSANGSSTMTSKLTANVTAKVTKVLPNGNLEIEAQRTLVTNADKQEITLTGTVRPEDIGSDNTVLSTYVADVVVKCTGKGPAGDRQKEGVITKLIKYIF
jgi:flagellar L-ring protein precursor FlgH